jgi:hypothetical protein
MILELKVRSLSCLQGFSTEQCRTLTLKNNILLSLMMVIKYTKMYDLGAYGSVSVLSKRFFN